MSLQVWLPLNGNLSNHGLGNVIISGESIFSAPGKIGGNSYNSSSDLSITLNSISGLKIWSFCFWGYIVSENITDNWTKIARIKDNSSDLRIETCPSTAYDGVYCYSVHNNSGYAITSGAIASPNGGYYDQWTHFCLTSDGTTINKYMNGTKIGSCLYDGSGSITGTLVLSNSDKIYKNDVRIYDHCLSPKEVKEISKGLVLHYPLSGPGQNNLLKNAGKYTINSKFNQQSSSKDGWITIPLYYNNLDTSKAYTYSVECDGTIYTHQTDGADPDKKYFTVWLYYQSEEYSDSSYSSYSQAVCYSLDNIIYINGTRYGWTFKPKYPCCSVRINTYSDGTTASNVNFWNFKIEEGNTIITPWCPNSEDALYATLGYANGIEYDTSGYDRNGTRISETKWDVNSPKYITSLVNTSDYLLKSTVNMPSLTNLSISFWIYINTWGTQTSGLFATSNQDNPSDYNTTAMHHRDGGVDIYANGTDYRLSCAPSAGTWHHCVFTYKNSIAKYYCDGVLTSSVSASGSLPAFKNIFIGYSYAGGVVRKTYGKWSDFRMYVTTLSDDDILELYNSPIHITNNGTLITQGEVSEGEIKDFYE